MNDLYVMHNQLSEEEIAKFENWIKSVTPRSLFKNTLSCYEIPKSRENYEAILKETNPCYIYCGASGGGRNHMIYYKSRDQSIYILCFWIQEFTAYWSVDDEWEKHIEYNTK